MTASIATPPKNPARKLGVQREVNTPNNGMSDEQIRRLAYQKWEAAGKPIGDGLCYWLEAERELCPS